MQKKLSGRGIHWIAFAILVVHVFLVLRLSFCYSAVSQEQSHLAAGVNHLLYQKFDLYRVNPPLVRSLAAIPVVCCDHHVDQSRYSYNPLKRAEYNVGSDFAKANGEQIIDLLISARMVIIFFYVFGGVICFVFSAEVYNSRMAGCLSLLLWCNTPIILGNSATIMSDVPAAAMGISVIFFFCRWLKFPGWKLSMIVGIALGLAELCKFTLLIFYPLLPIIWIIYRLTEKKTSHFSMSHWGQQGLMLTFILSLSVSIINFGYCFEGSCKLLEDYRFQTTMFSGYSSLEEIPSEGANRFTGSLIGKFPIPLPANMVQGIDTQRLDFERGLKSYLHGEWKHTGWWYYYLYALIIKIPLGTWILFILTVTVTTIYGKRYNASWRDEMIIIVPTGIVLFVFVSSQTGFSVHSRYIIPALPFFFIWTGKITQVFYVSNFTIKKKMVAGTTMVALLWACYSSLWIYPHSLSYFNELIGGPINGGEHLLDSNIDWGQDLFYLQDWLNSHPEISLSGLAYYGIFSKELIGIPEVAKPPSVLMKVGLNSNETRLQIPFKLKPGWYALSVNHLYSRNHQYQYFLNFEPVAMAGYSIYIYHITHDDANRVRRKLGLPELEETEILIHENKDN